MLFNSLAFMAFFLVVYAAYLSLRRWHRTQNALLLVASYFFYGWWDARFLALLAASTVIDFFLAQRLGRSDSPRLRRGLVTVSCVFNLGVLGVFEYFGFFSESFARLLE